MKHKASDVNRFKSFNQTLATWIGPAVFALGVIIALSLGLPIGIDIYQNWRNIAPQERSQVGITLIQTVATIIGGIAIFWNIVLSRQQLTASQEHNITERFLVAVEQLGHEQTAVRIGGIYALERIAQDSPRDYWSIMEVLAAFVRDRKGLEPGDKMAKQPLTYDKDIEAAIVVIGRRNTSLDPKGLSLYLSYSDLRGLSFFNDDHSNIRFVGCDLRDANFYFSNLKNTRFWKAQLTNAKFHKADLSAARLEDANLQGADFRQCILQGSDLKGANLKDAKGLTVEQIKSAHNWSEATFDAELMTALGLTTDTPQK